MAFWRLVDALCTGIVEVLAIVAWYGVYQYIVEKLPTVPGVSRSQHMVYLTMAGEPPLSSNSSRFCRWPLRADASGSSFKVYLQNYF